VDFTIEVERSLRVLDGAIAVFDAVAGVEPQSETVWRQANKFSVPRICFVNKMDRIGADFDKCVAAIESKLRAKAVPVQVPWGVENTFVGMVDVLEMKAYRFNDESKGATFDVLPVPEELLEAARAARERVVEILSEVDDEILSKYVHHEEIRAQELRTALRRASLKMELFPVLCGSAFKNKGVQLLLDAVLDYLPSPLDVPPVKGSPPNYSKEEENTLSRCPSEAEPFSALAFKIISDPYVGVLTFFRVYSGKVTAGQSVLNATRGCRERMGRLLKIHADKREDVKEITAGHIGATVGLKETVTGDTLCDPEAPIVFESIYAPEPVISVAIEPKTKADEQKMGMALAKLAKEDPSLKLHVDQESGQTIIAGMGELHLDIVKQRLFREFGVNSTVGKPQVAYRETITQPVEHQLRYAKQTGGRGQYAEVYLRVEPQERGKGFEFVDEIKGGVIPKEYIPAVKNGVTEALGAGVLAGFPVIDIKVTLYYGSFHEVDSSEMAFRVCASMCLKEACRKAKMIILEPVMLLEVVCPDDFVSSVIGDLNRRRGKILGMAPRAGAQVIQAQVPLAEMFGYATDLRSVSQGRAIFTMEYHHYEAVPAHVAEGILAR